MTRQTSRPIAFIVGLLAFLLVHFGERLAWNTWFGGVHEPWFLNSGPAAAVTATWLFVVGVIGGASGLPGLMLAGGAFVAMAGVLFFKDGGPGTIYPIVLVFGGALVTATIALGAWIGREIGGLLRSRR